MKIFGIDPGYERCGVAIIEKIQGQKDHLIFSGCIRTDSKESMPNRLKTLGEELEKILKTYQPDTGAIEQLYFAKNTKTALLVAEARGVIQYIISSNQLSCVEYHPNTIKIAVTGHGGAGKQDIIKMIPLLIDITHSKKLDDEFDAIAIALTHSSHIRF